MMCYLFVGSYDYVDDLYRLDACRTADLKSIPSVLQPVSTPLNYTTWSAALDSHPDVRFPQWKGSCYCDGMIPFGLRSVLKVFMTVADALEWCIHREGVERVFHYLDDFIIFAPPVSDQCQIDLNALKRFYSWLGTPLAAHKREGATTKLKFLEIEIDTVRGTMNTPS